jgi:ABC-type uncharacterized transport system permease subunit
MSFLSREATVAGPGFNRWLVPPAAISVHMCIGEVYGFSVFNVPLTQAGAGWTIPQVGWIYSIALVMLGLSAAVFGKWVERAWTAQDDGGQLRLLLRRTGDSLRWV